MHDCLPQTRELSTIVGEVWVIMYMYDHLTQTREWTKQSRGIHGRLP
jgi:hypothetical protein